MSTAERFTGFTGRGQPAGSRGYNPRPPIAFPAPTKKFGPVSIGLMYAKVMADESEDAKITGLTRSLSRRLLGLNVAGSLRVAGKASKIA